MKITQSALILSFCTCLTSTAHGQDDYNEIFTEAEAANGEFATNGTVLDSVTVAPDGTAYALSRENGGANIGGVVTAFDGTSFTTVMTPTQYTGTSDLAGFSGVSVVGSVIRGLSTFDNVVYEIDTTTGVYTEVVSQLNFNSEVSGTANLASQYETLADGTIYAYEGASDQILSVSPGNVVATEIDTTTLSTLAGGANIRGIGANASTIFLGSDSNDSLLSWDIASGTGSVVFTAGQINAVTGDQDGDGNASFGDIFAAPDGLVYFYENDEDYILSFDPLDAATTLSVVLTDDQLIAGPAGSDQVTQFAWYEGELAWTRSSNGFYAIPEPTTASFLALAGLGLLRRRRHLA